MDDLTGRLAIQDRVESYLSDVTFDLNEEQAAYVVTLKVNDDLTNQSYKASSEVEAKVGVLYLDYCKLYSTLYPVPNCTLYPVPSCFLYPVPFT